LARIRALLRRGGETKTMRLQVGDLVLDTLARRASRGGRVIELSTREYALLEFLMRHPGQVLGRTQIVDHVWSYDFLTTSNVVDVYIGYLRRKIDDDFEIKLIQTVRSAGYKIEAGQ
jgi:DNA-binding response OmpR family regulator